jgi:hypothetical protein
VWVIWYERIKESKVQADKSLRVKSRGNELEVSAGRLVREEQQRGLSTGAQVVGKGKKGNGVERRGEMRKNGSGGKEKVDNTSHDVVKVCAGGRWEIGKWWWMVDGMAVVEGEVSCSGGREGKEEWKANPDLQMERAGSSTSVEAVPDRRSPMEWCREAVWRMQMMGWEMTTEDERSGRKMGGWTGSGNMVDSQKVVLVVVVVRWKMRCRKRTLRTVRADNNRTRRRWQ